MDSSELIEKRISELADWRGKTIARIRELIHEVAPDIVEEWKWDTPVWTHKGNVLAVGAFQDHVKINFFYGALLADHRLFNAGLEAKTSRGIDLHEHDTINEPALKELIRSAVKWNDAKSKPAKSVAKTSSQKKNKTSKKK